MVEHCRRQSTALNSKDRATSSSVEHCRGQSTALNSKDRATSSSVVHGRLSLLLFCLHY